MSIPKTPDLYVLDALANDLEDLASILRMLNSDTPLGWRKEWGRDFTRTAVVEALTRLIAKDMVRVFVVSQDRKVLEEMGPTALPRDDYGSVYYGLTERGRLVHRNWEPHIK